MNPSLDHLLVAAAILGALGYLVRSLLVKRKKPGCNGCASKTPKLPNTF